MTGMMLRHDSDSQEREKLKEEKKKYAEQLKLWSKPREDMECEDLKVSECTASAMSTFGQAC